MPPKLIVLDGPNKSIWSNSRGFVVETTFLLWKEFLICFPLSHASQNLFSQTWVLGCQLLSPFLLDDWDDAWLYGQPYDAKPKNHQFYLPDY